MAEDERERLQRRTPDNGGGRSRQFLRKTEKAKDAKGTFGRLLRYLRPELPGIVVVMVFAVLSTCFDIFAPVALGDATTIIYDGIVSLVTGTGDGLDFDELRMVLTVLLALYLGYSVFLYLQSFIMARVAQNVVYDLRQRTEEKLDRLPVSYFDRHSKGDTLSRLVNDVDLISSTLQDGLTQLISSTVSLVGITIVMFYLSPVMALIALVTLPVSSFITKAVAKRSRRYYRGQQKALGVLDAHIEETFGGHTEVRAFARERTEIERFDEINERYFQSAWRAQVASGFIRPLTSFVGNLGYVGICIVGAVQVVSGTLPLGNIQTFLQYMRNFTKPITRIANSVNTIQATLASAERIFILMDEPEMDDESGLEPLAHDVLGGIEFDHVRFGYEKDTPVLHDLSFEARPGQVVAIVGPTGAGKTTIVNLLMRFHDVDSGAIRLDGTDTSGIRRDEVRRQFGMVLQDTWLFNGTIRDNIAYGLDDATDEEVVEAARTAHADHFIRTLAQGYDTVINEEGTNISVGQRQLLTIARALLVDPRMLILDEATSSIDTHTEQLVQDAMARLMAGRTSFVIAHRLSTIRDADMILVVDSGDIVETGTHEELLAAGGLYAELYNSQFDEVQAAVRAAGHMDGGEDAGDGGR